MLTRDNILFNAFKHHAGYMGHRLAHADQNSFFNHLKTIGNCQLDFYHGSLSVGLICSEVLAYLTSLGVYSFESYHALLERHDHYHTLVLSDHSGWVLRLGRSEEKFIHLHPARNSPNTLRITASALKTSAAMIYQVKHGVMNGCELNAINAMRDRYLSLPPVKKLADLKAVERIKKIVFDEFLESEI